MDRRSLRERKVSERFAVLDKADQRQAVNARLEALEEDDAQENALAPGSDDEDFTVREDSDGESIPAAGGSSKKRKLKTGSMRKTRGMVAERARGPKLFRDWLEEADLAHHPGPNYLTAAMGPPRSRSTRHSCTVCGDASKYSCTRCGSRFCSRRCNATHVETRCLKFTL
ncbi:hypothetical protein ACKKBG_A05605 [Auxenochlorella protothecoides x Auxenochlorella symbiontica]